MPTPTPSLSKSRHLDRLWIKVLFVCIALAFALLAWSSTRHHESPAHTTWRDDQGHLHVLGLTLEESTLRQAESSLKSRSDTALYLYPDDHPKAGLRLESFFPAIADHSKVILELIVDTVRLESIRSRATPPHIYPNQVLRMNLDIRDLPQVQQLTIKTLTLIPSIEITEDMLHARFGKEARSESNEEGTTKYYFPDIGLTAIISKESPAQLRFSNQP